MTVRWADAVIVLSECGDLPRRMLETHIPVREAGGLYCESCTADERVPWPCRVRSLALDAFVLQREIPSGAVVVEGRDDSAL